MKPKLARRSILPIVLFTMAVAGPAAGQTVPGRPSYGTSDLIFYPVLDTEFRPLNSLASWAVVDSGMTSDNPTSFRAPVRLPNGAFLTHLELDYIDNDPAANVSMGLTRCDPLMNNCISLSGTFESSQGPKGEGFVVLDLTPLNITVSNSEFRYFLQAVTQNLDTRILGAYIVYKLQVSPAPASATFTDVPVGHPFHRFVEALVDAGITAGCGGGNYCVNNPITRGEMAVFLSVALGLHFPG